MSNPLKAAMRGLSRRIMLVAMAVATCLMFLFSVPESQAMAKMCLFSPVSGVVLRHGMPVAGVRIERRWFWHWKDLRGDDSTLSDQNGKFSFPAVYGSSFFGGLLPHEPVIEQAITLHDGDRRVPAWIYTKGLYTENGELGGKPLKLRCHLDAEPERRQGIYGVCELE